MTRHKVVENGLALHQISSTVAVILALMTTVVSGALVVLTSGLHETSVTLRETVHGVRLTREARADLLLHERSIDPDLRAGLEAKLRQTLEEDFGYMPESPGAKGARDEAGRKIERYLATAKNSWPGARSLELEAALQALEPVAKAVLVDADRARAHAAKLDNIANIVAALATVSMVAVLAVIVFWTRRAVVRPMLALADAMDRFGGGDLAARAVPGGAAELRRMTQQFNDMGEALARQHHTRLAHLAAVAHDLRNPLAALQMSASLVDPEQPLPPEPSLRRAMALVRRQLLRLNRMVEDLLDAAQIDAGRLALKPRETDLREVVRDVTTLFKDVSAVHTFDVRLPEQPLVLACDPLRIEQTLSNLVSNAIKYSPRGGTIRIDAYRDDEVAKVSVTDDGIGIAQAQIEHLWEPFQRVGGVSSESIPGVGLGLWAAKRIAEAHHGTIVVQSVEGKGATFTLVLPLEAATADRDSGEPSPTSTALVPTTPADSHG